MAVWEYPALRSLAGHRLPGFARRGCFGALKGKVDIAS
jgi:hypothetical protein